jgi:hypothetical protein
LAAEGETTTPQPVHPGSPALRIAAALLVLAVILGSSAPGALAQPSGPPDKSFSIDVPAGFVPIPALEMYLAENPGRTGPVAPEALAAFRRTRLGFQAPADKWFTTPYLVVTLEEGKKRGPQDLFMDHVMAEKDSEAAASGSAKHDFLEKDHQPMKRMHYYKDRTFNSAIGGGVVTGVYTYLTSRGFLRVAWFATEEQARSLEQALHRAAMSVKLTPELEYKPEARK